MEEREEKTKGKKKRRSRRAVVEDEIVAAVRTISQFGDSLYIALPREFLERHGLKKGDKVVVAANHIAKIIPMKEKG